MRKIALTNAKGGVAKTTSCVNLGAGLALLGYRTLLIDCDTQGQVTKSLGVQAGEGLAELMQGEASLEDVQIEARKNLFVIAGGGKLSGVKRMISQRDMRSELVLSEALEDLQGYDFVLLDTAPSWDVLNVNCLFYVEEILIPVSMEVLALQGIGDLLGRVKEVQRYRDDLIVRGVIPTFYDGRVKKSAEILEQLERHFPDAVWPIVRYNSKLSEAPGFGQNIFEYAKRSNGAADYARLAERLSKGGERVHG
ncbi:MAG TPA: ParA family protein [Rubrobacteraceae bacterium]|nr:ParA family protein [Rubrobacteraceae bacterium]